jgi:tetratricopeptide (TPR) repeat protein
MRTRLSALWIVAGIAAAGVWLGESRADPAATTPDQTDSAPAATPPKVDRAHNVDFLFQALKAAPDDETARLIEGRIWALWLASGSDTADLLMSRARTAIEQNDADLAIQLLDSIIELKPDYTEAWNRRATLYFEKHDYGRAMSDIAQVLTREPRHFGALTGLGMILEDVGDDKRALQAFRRALEVDPRLERVPEIVKNLTEKVEGRNI